MAGTGPGVHPATGKKDTGLQSIVSVQHSVTLSWELRGDMEAGLMGQLGPRMGKAPGSIP